MNELLTLIEEYYQRGIDKQVNYEKYYLYSLITHSTAIEGSTITELENQIMFEQGISIQGKTIIEQQMNLDLKNAYEYSLSLARQKVPINIDILKIIAVKVMKNTGQIYNTALGTFSSADGDLRLLNVTAGIGGKSYMNYSKIPDKLNKLCLWINEIRQNVSQMSLIEKYNATFDAHYELVTIHPWADGNGRMARLLMNHLQFEFGLIPSYILKEDKEEYIKSLVITRETENYGCFRSFMLRNIVKNLKMEINNYDKSINCINTTSGKISDPQIFCFRDGYKISCRINGERQLGIILNDKDKNDWKEISQNNDENRKDFFKQQMAEKYFKNYDRIINNKLGY